MKANQITELKKTSILKMEDGVFEIEHSTKEELLQKVFDKLCDIKCFPVEVTLISDGIETLCHPTILHYCFAKSRISEQECVEIIYSTEN